MILIGKAPNDKMIALYKSLHSATLTTSRLVRREGAMVKKNNFLSVGQLTRQSIIRLCVGSAIFLAAGFLRANSSERLPPPNKSLLTEAEEQAPLFAVAKVGDFVVAASSNGFYRTEALAKIWERVSVPRGMSGLGNFAISPSDSNSVYFWRYASPAGKSGLYVSHDAGLGWTLVTDELGFRFFYPHRDGRLYAIINQEAKVDSETMYYSGLFMSETQGKTWKDISQNIFGDLFHIFSDARHTNRVCVRGNRIRGYIFEAADDNYSRWIDTREREWRKDSQTEEEFLHDGYYTTTVGYRLHATLHNYFSYGFGNEDKLPAFFIQLDTNHFEFASGEQVQVPITVRFLPSGELVKLVDATNNVEFWRIQCVCPDGRRVSAVGQTNPVEEAGVTARLKQRRGDSTGFHVVELTSTNYYTRTVALDKLANFSKPGLYRVRLAYGSGDWGWENNGHTGIWEGGFCSPIFTVTIKHD